MNQKSSDNNRAEDKLHVPSEKSSNHQNGLNYKSDLTEPYRRQLREADRSISNRDILIKLLQGQLKQIEETYKKSIDDAQEIRIEYCLAVEQLTDLQRKYQKSEESKQKLLKEQRQMSSKNESESITILKNELNRWKREHGEFLFNEGNTYQSKHRLVEPSSNTSDKNSDICEKSIYSTKLSNIENLVANQTKLLEDLALKVASSKLHDIKTNRSITSEYDPSQQIPREEVFKQEINRLEEENSSLKVGIQVLQDKLAKTSAEIVIPDDHLTGSINNACVSAKSDDKNVSIIFKKESKSNALTVLSDSEIGTLFQQINRTGNRLMTNLDIIRKECVDVLQENSDLKSQIERIATKSAATTAEQDLKITSLSQEIDNLRKENDKLNEFASKKQAVITDNTTAINDKGEEKLTKIISLETDNHYDNELEKTCKIVRILKTKISELEKENEDFQELIRGHEAMNQTLDKNISNSDSLLLSSLKEKEDIISNLEAQNQQLIAEVEKKSDEYNKCLLKIKEIQDNLVSCDCHSDSTMNDNVSNELSDQKDAPNQLEYGDLLKLVNDNELQIKELINELCFLKREFTLLKERKIKCVTSEVEHPGKTCKEVPCDVEKNSILHNKIILSDCDADVLAKVKNTENKIFSQVHNNNATSRDAQNIQKSVENDGRNRKDALLQNLNRCLEESNKTLKECETEIIQLHNKIENLETANQMLTNNLETHNESLDINDSVARLIEDNKKLKRAINSLISDLENKMTQLNSEQVERADGRTEGCYEDDVDEESTVTQRIIKSSPQLKANSNIYRK